MAKYNLSLDDRGIGVLTFINDGELETIDSSHPNFTRITDALLNGESIEDLLSIEKVITRLDSRVSIIDDVLHFDDKPIHNNLSNTILRYHREGRDTKGLVRFMERLAKNPSYNSREQLFTWSNSADLTINNKGMLVGYKGVYERDENCPHIDEFTLDEYPWRSSSAGTAIVDGVTVTGHIPMGIGSVIEMPRDQVNDNPNEGCSMGLHVGSYSYASGFARVLIEVEFDPADVVSVPRDCSFEKLRCCRYVPVAVHDRDTGDDLTDHEPEPTWQDEAVIATLEARVEDKSILAKFKNRLFGN